MAEDDDIYEPEVKRRDDDPRLFKTHLGLDYQLLDGWTEFLGYKVVQFNNLPLSQIYVVVWLQVRTHRNLPLYFSETGQGGQLAHVDQLRRGTKFCTSSAHVLGLQFVGQADTVVEANRAYQDREGSVHSLNYPDFRYEVTETVVEDRTGEEGNHGCRKGVHFFVDPESAIAYSGVKTFGDLEWPIITRRLTESRGVIVALPVQQVDDGVGALAPDPCVPDPSVPDPGAPGCPWSASLLAPHIFTTPHTFRIGQGYTDLRLLAGSGEAHEDEIDERLRALRGSLAGEVDAALPEPAVVAPQIEGGDLGQPAVAPVEGVPEPLGPRDDGESDYESDVRTPGTARSLGP